jgi:hypothetical protein
LGYIFVCSGRNRQDSYVAHRFNSGRVGFLGRGHRATYYERPPINAALKFHHGHTKIIPPQGKSLRAGFLGNCLFIE